MLFGGTFCQVKKNKLIPLFKPDVVVNCCHGGEGENGILSGVLEFNGLAHTSPKVLPSALCMDKTASKIQFDSLFLNTAKGKSFSLDDYKRDESAVIEDVEAYLNEKIKEGIKIYDDAEIKMIRNFSLGSVTKTSKWVPGYYYFNEDTSLFVDGWKTAE